MDVNNMVNDESSDRELSPHEFMPMLGVHHALQRTRKSSAPLKATLGLSVTWIDMAVQNTNIIFIGPVGAGKSTQGQLVAKALNKPSLSLDSIANKYYEANGFSSSQFHEVKSKIGYLKAYRYWWPSLAYAAQQVVLDYPDCVIDFGAGHSHYEDESLFLNVSAALSCYSNIILLLPSPDLDKSVLLLRERSSRNWVHDGYDFIEHWVKDDCNHRLSTMTIYTDGKEPEETRDEILNAIKR